MGGAYPELVKQHELVLGVVSREEERFRQTLARGLDLLDGVLGRGDVTGEDAFFLHDTLGFPIDLTREIAGERGRAVDLDGFHARMEEQRTRAKEAHKAAGRQGRRRAARAVPRAARRARPDRLHRPPGVRDRRAPRCARSSAGRDRLAQAGPAPRSTSCSTARRSTPSPAVRSATPAIIETSGGARGPGRRHAVRAARPRAPPGRGRGGHRSPRATRWSPAIDGERRDRIRRNHTATHVLHWALREVLGQHVKQAGSFVGPDRLRFDFSHHEAVTREQLDRVEALANAEIIGDAPVRHYETTKEHAGALGAIAFFGDKYGDLVRVLEAGEHSIELCGGTHVHALGFIGPIKIVSEGSIGANLRRIEAVTGDGALARIHDEEVQLRELADTLQGQPAEVPDRVERLLGQVQGAPGRARGRDRRRQAGAEAATLAAAATDGVVVVRRDGLDPDELRTLAIATRDALGSGVVALVGRRARRRQGRARGRGHARTSSTRACRRRRSRATPPRRSVAAPPRTPTSVQGGGPNVDAVDDALALLDTARAAPPSGEPGAATRVLGVDLGSRRIGLAATDPSGTLASPLAAPSAAASRSTTTTGRSSPPRREVGAKPHRGRPPAFARRQARARRPGPSSTRSRRCRRWPRAERRRGRHLR